MYTTHYDGDATPSIISTLTIKHYTGKYIATITVYSSGVIAYDCDIIGESYTLVDINQNGVVVTDKPTLE